MNLYPLLPERTVIAGRFVVLRSRRVNGEGATYAGFDLKNEQPVEIREFYPIAIVKRATDRVTVNIMAGQDKVFGEYKDEFEMIYKALKERASNTSVQRVMGLASQHGTLYAVSEPFPNAVTLESFLTLTGAGFLGWRQTERLMGRFLSQLNELGLVHGGISPDTLYINTKGEIKLTDFCIPAVRRKGSKLSPELYSGYSAPEQYADKAGESVPSAISDVYAVSAVLYRILTGIKPQGAAARWLGDTLSSPRMVSPEIPEHISSVIMKGLEPDAAVRIKNIANLNEAITATAAQSGLMSGKTEMFSTQGTAPKNEPPAPKKKPKKKSKHRIPYTFISTVLSTIILVTIAWYLFNEMFPGFVTGSTTFRTSSNERDDPDAPTSSSAPEDFVMPKLIGQYLENVENNPQYTKYIDIELDEDYDPDQPAGVICNQSLSAGTLVTNRVKVILTVSKGAKRIEVPDVKNRPLSEAISMLEGREIKYEIKYQLTPSVDMGYVFKTDKSPGSMINTERETLIVYVNEQDPDAVLPSDDGVEFPSD